MGLNLGVLASGSGSNLQAIIDAVSGGRLPVSLRAVISDNPDAFALKRAEKAGIQTRVVTPAPGAPREAHDEKVVAALKEMGADAVALAGYMLMVTPVLLKAFPGRVVNIHPALLPAFPGLHVQAAALMHGVKFSGCTVHFVDEGMDTGPIIIQAVVPVRDDDTEETLAARILREEHRIYPQALKYLAEGRLKVTDGRVTVDPPEPGSGTLHNPPVSF